jgi:N-acetylglucosaminyldiphosphoundecaprenol N-acetyl-beta-D-mannosaminyltransferase
MDNVVILGVGFDNVTMDEAVIKVLNFLKGDKTTMVVTPNPEIVQICVENQAVKKVINSADLVVADGIGVIYASKILKKPLKEKVPGFERAHHLLKHIEKWRVQIILLGASNG